jgi:hypothetical protein
MKITLERHYLKGSTIGELLDDKGKHICFTLELPWRNNQRNVSCVPEGVHKITRRFTATRGWHLQVHVPDRSFILIHIGNDADDRDGTTDSAGCILPNMSVVIEKDRVRGAMSRVALQALEAYVMPYLERGVEVQIEIKKANAGT